MSKFFIERPIFAWVVAILIMLAGAAALLQLPISQFPDVAPPAIAVSGRYPGASAQTVKDSVVQTIEQQLNGLTGFRYMSSSSTSSGDFTITVTFDQGTDPDIAQVQVQNKVQLATPMLPSEVQQQGITVAKSQVNFMLIVAAYCDDDSVAPEDLNDLTSGQLKDAIGKVSGVGAVDAWAFQYAMRVWLDPEKLRGLNMTPSDAIAAIREQNVQVSAGQIGGDPSPDSSRIAVTVVAKNRMSEVQQFKDILVRTNSDGSQVRLSDIAEVELGSENYSISSKLNGNPGAALGVRLASGGNVLKTTEAVKKVVEEQKRYMPNGVKIAYLNENAPNVEASIHAVVHTLIEAFALVFIVMFLFLQRFRATLVPTLTIPVVLLGTFGVLYAAGFTLNVVVLFAMTLAIGLLVDDAIVVVENVERLMEEEGLDAKAATLKTMEQIQGALVGVGATISAVFLPTVFFGGSTGIIYRQFAIAIISAMLLSVFIALTFAPALCATILKSHKEGSKPFILFRMFNNGLAFCTNQYGNSVKYMTKRCWRFMLVFCLICALVAWWFPKLPTAFLPTEDQGTLYVTVMLPQNASSHRTQEILDDVAKYFVENETDVVDKVLAINGYSFSGRSSSAGMFFIALKPFAERTAPGTDVFSLLQRANAKFASINGAVVTPIVPPSMPELGNVAGLDFYLQDNVGFDHDEFVKIRGQFLKAVMDSGLFSAAWANTIPDEPQYKIEIDEAAARAYDLDLGVVNQTLSVAWGGAYVNDFLERGKIKRVFIQGKGDSRASVDDFDRWFTRNNKGAMVPFSAFASGYWTYGSPSLSRYNAVTGVEFNAVPAPGVSSGVAMAKVEEIVKDMPKGVGVSFTGISYEEHESGSAASKLFALALLIVFLCLAALYESWSVPIAIGMVVPFGVLGAVAAVAMRGMTNDVFFQVGLLTVMGLSAKNAILIVEFAKQMVEQGVPLLETAYRAAILRLRPILMTSAAFALGVYPMTKAIGASSVSQRSLGTSVLGGTIVATVLAIFFVPLFYVLVVSLFTSKKKREALEAKAA